MARWTKYRAATGELVRIVTMDNMLAPEEALSTDVPPEGQEYLYQWQDLSQAMPLTWLMIPDAMTAVEAELIARIKAEAERRKMLVLTAGDAKKRVYPRQDYEVAAWEGLGPDGAPDTVLLAAFDALDLVNQRRRFRFATASAARHGEPDIIAAINRFRAGADASDTEVARLEAIEQFAVAAIKAAGTITAKQAAAAAVDWNWTA